jgi:hypothetical protein
MKKLLNYTLLFMILLCCTACPYDSVVPIDVANLSIDENILGNWKEQDSNNKDFFAIKKLDNQHYTIIENTLNESLEIFEKKEYQAHFSEVDNTLFLNLQAKKDSKTFLLYKIEVSADKKQLTLLPLSEYIKEKFANSKELRNFISKNKNLSFFYGKEMVLVKM